MCLETFATDSAISGRVNGQAYVHRELQPFICDGPLVDGLDNDKEVCSVCLAIVMH